MADLAQVTVTAPNPPNPVSVSSPDQGAERVIEAAIQTGAAAERAETAAAKATQAEVKTRSLAEELATSLRPQLTEISERLAKLETMEEEEIEEENTSNSQEIAGAAIVELEEPKEVKKSQANTQAQPKPEKKGRAGFLSRVFLNK